MNAASIRDCPKFDSCSAPICPLDPDWHLRRHLSGEPVCLWLRELSKPGGKAILRGCVPMEVATAIRVAYLKIIVRQRLIKIALERSAQSTSKVRAGRLTISRSAGRS